MRIKKNSIVSSKKNWCTFRDFAFSVLDQQSRQLAFITLKYKRLKNK